MVNFNPIKLCSHWKKGEAENKQKAINKEITSLNDQYKTLFDLKREKFQKNEISALWYKLMYKKFMDDHSMFYHFKKTTKKKVDTTIFENKYDYNKKLFTEWFDHHKKEAENLVNKIHGNS